MDHSIYKITEFRIIAPYTLELKFDDCNIRKINFKNILYGEMFSPLRNLNLFNQVKIDPEVHTIVWPNGADFDPETLYNWDKYKKELTARAKKWKTVLK